MRRLGDRLRRHGLFVLVLALAFAIAPAAIADPLDDAKASGYVGEKRNGMLGLVDSNAPASVQSLVNSVNAKRKEAYEAIAKKNGTSLAAVAALAGEKAIEKTAKGHYVEGPNGWQKK